MTEEPYSDIESPPLIYKYIYTRIYSMRIYIYIYICPTCCSFRTQCTSKNFYMASFRLTCSRRLPPKNVLGVLNEVPKLWQPLPGPAEGKNTFAPQIQRSCNNSTRQHQTPSGTRSRRSSSGSPPTPRASRKAGVGLCLKHPETISHWSCFVQSHATSCNHVHHIGIWGGDGVVM